MARWWTTVRIIGPSMEPALRSGECWLVWRCGRCRPGDIVVLRHPMRDDLLIVKRVVRHDCDGYWVQGDNPRHTDDSRAFGSVPADRLVGRLGFRYQRARRPRAR
ncbi:MAG: S26 family signal peptidase [Actinomycetales bacterium]